MKQKQKSKLQHLYERTTFTVSEELSERMKKPLFPEKFAKATEMVKKLGLDKLNK